MDFILRQIFQLIKQTRDSSDGSVMLPPGDYVVPVHLYCMKAMASSPSGHCYALAPLKGKMADVITILNARVVGSDIPPSDIQALSWHIQAGMKYQEMSSEMRSLFDQLLPEYRDRLSMSFYEQILRVWDQLAITIPNLPSLEESLSELGDVGRAIIALQQTREALFRYSDDFESLSNTLVSLGTSSLLGESAKTPWSRINNQVYGRMVTEGHYMSPGELQLRIERSGGSAHFGNVTQLAVFYPSSITASDAVLPAMNQTLVKVPITSLVANPRDAGIQPLSMSPRKVTGTNAYPTYKIPSHWPFPTYEEKQFKNCRDAQDYLDKNLNNRNFYVAKIEWGDLEVDPNQKMSGKYLPDGTFQAEVVVNFIPPRVKSIILPRWTWPNMTNAERAALQKYMDALIVHEQGHEQIGKQIAENWSGATESAIGSSQQEAIEKLKAAIEKMRQQRGHDMKVEQKNYDLQTENGARQSKGPEQGYPGGADAILDCP